MPPEGLVVIGSRGQRIRICCTAKNDCFSLSRTLGMYRPTAFWLSCFSLAALEKPQAVTRREYHRNNTC